jgi:hypothetical protein
LRAVEVSVPSLRVSPQGHYTTRCSVFDITHTSRFRCRNFNTTTACSARCRSGVGGRGTPARHCRVLWHFMLAWHAVHRTHAPRFLKWDGCSPCTSDSRRLSFGSRDPKPKQNQSTPSGAPPPNLLPPIRVRLTRAAEKDLREFPLKETANEVAKKLFPGAGAVFQRLKIPSPKSVLGLTPPWSDTFLRLRRLAARRRRASLYARQRSNVSLSSHGPHSSLMLASVSLSQLPTLKFGSC